MSTDFEVFGTNEQALFTLRVHRGDGMVLLGMNWKAAQPPEDFVGFAIEYREPGNDRFYSVKNRLNFLNHDGSIDVAGKSSLLSPIQKFRWVHFPRNAEIAGAFTYRVTPAFMNEHDELSYGVPQSADVELRRETYPGVMNVAFTRGLISSQAFLDRIADTQTELTQLLPMSAAKGLDFVPTLPRADEALNWMGFEARSAIFEVLEAARSDLTSEVLVVAYDLNEPLIVDILEDIGARLRIIIDNSDKHGDTDSAETRAAERLAKSAGSSNVKRQHMGSLQHNKTIAVSGSTNKVVCGSTNFTWRGLYVQANNAIVLQGASCFQAFQQAFNSYWESDRVEDFGPTTAASWQPLGLAGLDAKVSFSPHSDQNARLAEVASDLSLTSSSLFYSLAFLYQTQGPIRSAVEQLTKSDAIFVYGSSDQSVGGLDIQQPNGNLAAIHPEEFDARAGDPFRTELTGGSGVRLHHKFIVVDFDKPDARVYVGSYNFSAPADRSNGENLLLIRDRRVAVSYMIEALRIFDHYRFRIARKSDGKQAKPLALARPPRSAADQPWWRLSYSDPRSIKDRLLFS